MTSTNYKNKRQTKITKKVGSKTEASSEKWGNDVFQTSQNNKTETTKEKRPPEIGIDTISSLLFFK